MSGKGSSQSDKRSSRDELKFKLNRLQEQQKHQEALSHVNSEDPSLPFSNVLSKRDNRASLPVFAGSSAHAGVINANSGEDVNFVVGLSENLLVECRRLQAQNERKSAKLSSLQADYEKLKINLERLTVKHESMTKNEDSLKDTNWRQEMKLQSLSKEFQELTENFNKNKSELERQIELSKDMKTELEESSLERMGLKSELASSKKVHSNEIKELKRHVEELNNENDQLHNKVNMLSEKVTSLTKEIEERKGTSAQGKDDTAIATSEQKPSPAVKLIGGGMEGSDDSSLKKPIDSNLENQTLKANLNHANQLIVRLKQKLNRVKADSTMNSPLPSKSPRGKNKGGLSFIGSASTPQKSNTSSFNYEVTDNESGDWNVIPSPGKSSNADISDIDAESFVSETMDYVRDPISEGPFEHDEDFINELDYEDIERYAKTHNFALVPITELDELKKSKTPSTISDDTLSKHILSRLSTLGYFDTSSLTNNEKVDIEEIFKHPTEDYLVSNLKRLNLTAIKEEEYQSLNDPSMETLKKSLESKDYTALSKKDYENLLHASESPSLSYLESKAHKLQKTIIDIDEYENLRKPDVEALTNHAQSIGLQVLKQSQLTDIKAKLESPSEEYLQAKADAKGLTVLTKSKLSQLTEPSIEDVQQLATTHDHILISNKDYHELLNPSIDKVEKIAANHKLSVIPDKDLIDLKCKAESPDINRLKECAKSKDHVLLPNEEHTRLMHGNTHPSIEAIQSSLSSDDMESLLLWLAERKSITPIRTTEYHKLTELANTPPLDHLKKAAKALDYTLLSQAEIENLRNLAQNPPFEHLKDKLLALNYTIIKQEDLHKLKEQLESPTLNFLSEKAAEKNYDIILKTDHSELLRKSSDPTIQEMQHLAAVTGHLIVSQSDYDYLNKTVNEPSRNFIIEKAKDIGMVTIEQKEYEKLVHKGSDKTMLLESIKNFGFVPVTAPDFNSFKQKSIDNVDIDQLTNRLETLGYVAVSKEGYSKLMAPVIDKVTKDETFKLCDKYNLKPVAAEAYQKLQESSKVALLSEDELIKKVKEHGHVVLDSKSYEDLINKSNNPQLKDLSRHLSTYKMVPVQLNEYENLMAMKDSPSLTFLKEKAKLHHQTMLPFDELEGLKSKLEHPSREYLENMAGTLGLALLPIESIEELKTSYENPSIAHLSNRASNIGKRLIDQQKYDNLQRKTNEPTVKEVEQLAARIECKVLPTVEYEELQLAINNPSIKRSKEVCDINGYSVVPTKKFNELQLNLTSPSLEFLQEKAQQHKQVLLPIEEHNKLQMSAVTDEQGLQRSARSLGLVVVPEADYDSLSNPSLHILQKQITEKGHVVLDAETYKSLNSSNVDSISKQEVIGLCSKFDLIPLPEKHYKELTVPSIEKVKQLVEPLALTVIDREELAFLKTQVDNPSEESVVATAPKYGYKLLGDKEYENLQNEAKKLSSLTKIDIEKLAAKLGLVVLSEESYDALIEKLKKEVEVSSMSPRSKVAASKLYFENVIKKENSNKEVVLESGKLLGFVRLSNDEYKRLLENQQKHELTKTDIYNGAKAFDLTVLPSEEYNNLLQRKAHSDNITYDDLQLYASRFALKLVPVNFTDEELEKHNNQRVGDYGSRPALNLHPSVNHSTVSFNSVSTGDTDYYDALQSSSSFNLRNSPSKSSMHTSSTHYTDANDFLGSDNDNVSLASTIKDNEPTLEDLQRHAEVLGYNLIEKDIDCHQNHYSTSLTPEDLTKDIIYSAAPQFGLSVVPTEEFIEMEKLITSERLTPDSIRESAKKYGLIVLTEAEHSQLVKKSTQLIAPAPIISTETIKQKAREHGLVPVATNDYLKLIKPDSADDIKEKASKLGIVTLAEEDYKEIKKPLTRELLEARAKELELVTLPVLEYSALKKPLTVTDIKQKCEDWGLVPIEKDIYEDLLNKFNDDSVSEWAKEHGKVIVSKDEYDHLLEVEDQAASVAMTRDELIERAHELNIIPIDADKFEEIQRELASSGRNSMTEDDVVLKAKELGFVPIPVSQYDPNTAIGISKDDLMIRARDLGLVPIPIEQFEQIKKELETPTLTREQIVEHAADFNLIALDLTEYKRLKKGSYLMDNDNDTDSEEDEEEEEDAEVVDSEIKQLNKAAKRFGLLCIPESAFVATSNANTPDVHNVVVLPIKYYNSLLHQESENWAKITDENLQAEAKKRGFQVVVNLRKDFGDGFTQGHRRNSSLATRSVISEDARRSMSEAAANAAMSEMEQQTRSRAPSRSSSIKRPSPSLQTNQASLLTHSESMATGLSLATMASLSAPSIIPALTQTMIGEYLHKYYRRLGGSLFQSSRHERYFWVHPYTLTLYWSTSNPVLENPGNNKTRAAAIMGVESVDDPCPFPAGLYQKSIIVKTEGRDIKLTCATRQRHNIWFNSLRYLLQRNLDGINLDDMLRDDNNVDSNTIYQLPGESSQTATRRLSSTRRASSSSYVKRSTSKWSLRAN